MFFLSFYRLFILMFVLIHVQVRCSGQTPQLSGMSVNDKEEGVVALHLSIGF